MSGWVMFQREMLDHEMWLEEPFTRGQAWVDLFATANWKDSEAWIDGRFHPIKRGQFITSMLKLSARWRWSRKKVKLFLENLKNAHMIDLQVDTKKTTITIVNYDKYQSRDTAEGTAEVAPSEQRRNNEGTTNAHKQEDNNNKKVKKKEERITRIFVQFGKHLRMEEVDMETLRTKYGQALINQELGEADIWIDRAETPTARNYRKPEWDHFLFFNNWLKDKRLKNQNSPFQKETNFDRNLKNILGDMP